MSLLSQIRNGYSEKIARALDREKYDFKFLDGLGPQGIPFNRFWRDGSGNTLMHYAARLGFKKRIEQLKRYKCPILANDAGKTPLDLFKEIHPSKPVPSLLSPKSRQDRLKELYPREGGRKYLESETRVHPGIYFTSDLTLKFGDFIIPAKHHLMMEQAMTKRAERLNRADNFVMATLGFIVSAPEEIQGKKFVKIPIDHPEYLIFAQEGERPIHSEEHLYNYLNETSVLDRLLDSLREVCGCTIFAVVMDIHSRYTMCGNCEKLTYEMQADSFRDRLEQGLKKRGYLLPEPRKYCPDVLTPEKSQELYYVTRVSATAEFRCDTGDLARDSIGAHYPKFEEDSHLKERDIVKFANSVILHLRPSQSSEGVSESQYEAQTLFQNTHPYRAFRLVLRKKRGRS